MLLQLSQLFPIGSPPPSTPHSLQQPSLSSCPWVMHVSSSASPFPIQFLTSPCLFYIYQSALLFFKCILLIMLSQLSHFPPFIPLCPAHPLPLAFPPFSSCPCVIHISSLASTFPILTLPLSIFYLPFMLILCTFTPLSPSHSLIDNPRVLVVCLVCSRFCFMCGR